MAQLDQETLTPAFIPAWDAGSKNEPQNATQSSFAMYELRPRVRMSNKMTPTAWLDQDKSGNYKAKLNNVRKSRARKVTRPRNDSTLEPTTDRGNDEAARIEPKEQVQAPQIRRTRRPMVELESRSISPKFDSRQRYTAQALECAEFKDYDHVISRKNLPNNPSTGIFQTLVTRFAHPIQFNYEPPTPFELSCHWCDDILYGLVGLGPIEVEVIDYRNGGGYKEIENGHRCAGHLPSRMCIKCTLARLAVAACTSHQIEPIEGVNPDAFTVSSYQGYLVPGMTGFAPFEWCCICPAPASYRCLKPQEPDMLCSHPKDGCGLLLCERCASFLVGKFGGVLERLIDQLKLQDGESVLRADAEFLHPRGELWRRFFYAGGIS